MCALKRPHPTPSLGYNSRWITNQVTIKRKSKTLCPQSVIDAVIYLASVIFNHSAVLRCVSVQSLPKGVRSGGSLQTVENAWAAESYLTGTGGPMKVDVTTPGSTLSADLCLGAAALGSNKDDA